MNDLRSLSASAIKEFMKKIESSDYEKYISILLTDHRKAVQTIGMQYQKKIDNHKVEIARINELWNFEEKLASEYIWVAGIDEAGRGPLAGPVVASAVILPKRLELIGVNDSKVLSESKRDYLFDLIMNEAISVGIGIVDHKVIDEMNILNATKQAMKIAINQLSPSPEILLIDAVRLTDIDIKQENIIKGDSKSISIAAASIIAKVTRDKIMVEINQKYPEYGFAAHKGYGTKQHIDAIRKFGATDIHRRTFITSFI